MRTSEPASTIGDFTTVTVTAFVKVQPSGVVSIKIYSLVSFVYVLFTFGFAKVDVNPAGIEVQL